MIWSCISEEGPNPIYFVEGEMNSEQCMNVIKNVLLPYMKGLNCPADGYSLMQDGAASHTSRKSTNFLYNSNIFILPSTGNSANLNPP